MHKELEIENYGKLTINKNEFLGTIDIKLNGDSFNKVNKKLYKYRYNDEEIKAEIIGNGFSGSKVKVLGNVIELTTPVTWYGFIISIIPLIFSLVLGNMQPVAKSGFYVLGGGFGGALGGLALALGLYLDTLTSLNKAKKLLFILISSVVTIGLLIGFGFMFAKALKN